MKFGTQSISSAPTNDLTGLVVITGDMPRPSVAPLWDDLQVAPNGSVSYRTTGTAPNRVFTMQWLNMEWGHTANTPGISFQVKLYEGTDAVQFVYRQEAGILATPSASIGLAGEYQDNFISLSDSGTNPTVNTSLDTETTTISTKPATGQIYTFTPQRADLAMSITDAPEPLATTAYLTYTINLTNNGPHTVVSPRFTANIPANTTFVTHYQNTGVPFTCTSPPTGGTGTVNCKELNNVSALASGALASFTLVVRVISPIAAGTIISNTVSATDPLTYDLNAANNSAATTTTVAPPPPPLIVTRSDDRNNPTCAPGDCSLREAIKTANATFNNTIQFSALFDSPRVITLTNGQLTISEGVRILGKGSNLTTVSGNNASRVIKLDWGHFNVTISGLTIANGKSLATFWESGGGLLITNRGTVNLTNCAFTNNNSGDESGGGLSYNTPYAPSLPKGVLNITGCTFSGNTSRQGGAISIGEETVNITNTTVSGNTVTGYGGGISNYEGNLTITNSTVTGNTSTGTWFFHGGGGLTTANIAGITTVTNSIIAGNTAVLDPDVRGNSISGGYNFIGKFGGWSGFTDGVNNDQVGTIASPKDPLLLPLSNYGGTTQTHALPGGSPALDKGFSFGSTIDQRGLTRPVDLAAYANAPGGNASDIGAYEAQTAPLPPPDLTVMKTHTGNFTQGDTGKNYRISVTNSGTGPTSGLVSVTDTLPFGLTATLMSGTGWSCNLSNLTCTRSDSLGANGSYPAIFLTVNVASNAPTSVTNIATVSGGGEINTANNTASDPTTINAVFTDGFDPGANGTVSDLAVQSDGKILAGGNFTQLGGGARNFIARLNADGTLDTTFNPGANGPVFALAVQADGKILVGGQFTQLDGQTRDRLARLNPDGTIDTSFNPGANDLVFALAVQSDGKIAAGGNFTTLGGQTRDRIGRLNVDGTLDVTFNPGANNSVVALALQADGKIVVGGVFTQLGGQPRNNIGRLNSDGTPDNTFNPGANGIVYALALQSDGRILVGGTFTQLSGQPRNRIARLNSDGTPDTTFNPGANGSVFALAVQSDGRILVGGQFTQLGGQLRNNIGRLNSDGTPDTTFNPGASGNVHALAVQADGKILVGGAFTQLGGQPRNQIGRLNPDGTLDTTFNPGANNTIHALAVQADGRILVGGTFTQLGGQPRDHIGRLNADGTLDTTFNPGANGGDVFALALQSDGKIVVGGNFTQLSGQPRNNIGRLTNTDAALQLLSVNPTGTTITWLRSGASPEVNRVSFELSTDNLNYIPLGAGTRITGGWQLTEQMLPGNQNLFIRTRGFYSTGQFNGSASIVESVRNAFLSPPTTPTPTPTPTPTSCATFINATTINIPYGPASPYPSTINVSGLSGTVTKATVTLNGLTHTWSDDIDVLLVGPGGRSVILMSDAGDGATNANLTFDDTGAMLPQNGQIVSGTFQPTNFFSGTHSRHPHPWVRTVHCSRSLTGGIQTECIRFMW